MTHMSKLFVVLAIAAAAGACGKSNSSPVAPSARPAVSPQNPSPGPSSTGATISGTVLGVARSSGWSPRATGITVTISGSSASSPVDDNGRFELRNVPSGRVDLHFQGANVDAHLELNGIAESQTIVITVRVSGSTAQLEDNMTRNANREVEIEGSVSAVGANSLTVAARIISVSASTQIVQEGRSIALSRIAVGDRVGVKGTETSTDGTIAATKIELEKSSTSAPGNDDASHSGQQAEVEGTIAAGSLSGSCAARSLAFAVGATKIVTNASTQFKGGRCEALQAGTKVEVKGARQNDGRVLAATVESDGHDEKPEPANAEAEVKGTIAAGSLGGSCGSNSLSFKVGATTVKTNASTRFEETSCAALKTGDSVEVKGMRQNDGTVLASRIEKK